MVEETDGHFPQKGDVQAARKSDFDLHRWEG